MKYSKLFLLVCLFLAACAAVPVSPTPVKTVTPQLVVVEDPIITSTPVVIDAAMGIIKGNISWLDAAKLTKVPINNVNLEINGHLNKAPRYTAKTDANGNYSFVNIEPNNYGLGIYFSIPLSERRCEYPEFNADEDLSWLHYSTQVKFDSWFDIIFSSKDVLVDSGKTVVMDFVLKCQ